MFEFLLRLFQTAGNQVNVFNQLDIDTAIQALSTWMNGGLNPTIRMFVDSGGGRGNQAGGVNMLKRITEPNGVGGLNYVGAGKTVEIVYNDSDAATVVKLRQLLQFGLAQDNGAWPVGAAAGSQVQVQLIASSAAVGLAQVNLGFSGVSDFNHGLPTLLNVVYYLRFQPFLYHQPVQLQFLDGTPTINLATVPELGGASYIERGFRIVVPGAIVWATYTGAADPVLAARASILEYLITNLQAGGVPQYELLLTYSIHTNYNAADEPTVNAIGAEPYGQVVQLVLGCLATQTGARALAHPLPVVIVNLDHFYNNQPAPPPNGDPFEPVVALLGGAPTMREQALLQNAVVGAYTPIQRQVDQTWVRRAAYVAGVNAVARTTFLDQPTLVRVQQVIPAIIGTNDRVVWIQLGALPNELFNFVLSQSTFPSVFEGVNTANVALNFGTPYFHVNRPGNRGILYPTRVLANRPGDAVLRRLQTAADQIGVTLDNWPNSANAATYPPELIAAWIREYRTEAVTGAMHQYFTNLRAFYQNTANDKLSLALTYLQQRRAAAPLPLALAQATAGCSDLAVAETPLDALYASLNANLDNGVLALVPGALTGGKIQQFLYNVVVKAYGQPLTLSNATIVPVPADGKDITQITVTGTTDVFGPTATTTVVFTAPEQILLADLDFGFDVRGSFAGMDWIIFANPSVGLVVSDGTTLTQGSARGSVVVGQQQLDISWRFPTPDDAMLITAAFVDSYPSIDAFFQLAGGINLVKILPPPFNVLADLGLAELEVGYDVARSLPNSLAFTIRSNSPEPIPLFGQIALQDLVVQVNVESPGSLVDRRTAIELTGDFALAKQTPDNDPAIIRISATAPGFVFGGELVEGTITFAELATFFLSEVPPLPATPTITEFSFSYNQPQAAIAVSVNLNIGWDISVAGAKLLNIENLQMSISNQSNLVTSRLVGTLLLFPDSEDALGLELSATQDQSGWLFAGRQRSGQVPLGKLLGYLGLDTDQPYGIDGLAATISTTTNAWMFQGKTAQPWVVPFIPELSVSASLRMGASPVQLPDLVGAPRANNNFFARLETRWRWQQIDIVLWFDYNLQTPSFGFTWGILEAAVKQDSISKDWIGTLKFTNSVTLGSMVETMVEWVTGSRFALEAPWSLLNGISLGKLALIYNFTKNTVSFQIAIGPINLGFASIDGIEITYASDNPNPDDNGVLVKLTGSFPWNTGAEANGDQSSLGPWDTAKPGTAPTPPGNGNKYIDLRLLALGQHITMPCFATADTVQKAIACMATMPAPEPGKPPPVQFDSKSSWLIGTDFGILRLEEGGGYMLTLQVVFNDPHLYALRIALAGAPAKIFKGLDFQILYRQISEAVGVYQAQITLPDVMRRLSVGAYTITLPVFAIDVYTNGDFQVDIGFPWNQDFSRSFTVEAIIAPGIPLLGSAGFYFGKLSSASTNRVPTVSNGTFNPVIVFGFGLQAGFGKSIELGILKAGFSLTVFGIIEGVIGKWNPYALTDGSTSGKDQLQGAYYFKLQGTIGIIGKLYGTIDFAIIKADLNIEIKLMVQLTYESYVSIALTVLASVDVSLSVKINLGLFKIRINLSFSARIKETFVIENHGTAPWKVVAQPARGRLDAPVEARLGLLRPLFETSSTLPTPNWSNLIPATSKAALAGYVATAPTVAMDEWQPGVQSAQESCGVMMLFINSVPPAGDDAGAAARKAAGDLPDSSFETLAKLVLIWTVAAVWGQPISADMLIDQVIDGALLDYLAEQVLVSTDANPTPITSDALAAFLRDQVAMTVTLPPDQDESAEVTAFPMPAELMLGLPKYASYPGYAYQLAEYNELDQNTLIELRSYFDQLAVQVQSEQDRESVTRLLAEADKPLSMAGWIASDYFLLLARQMVQAARDALRDFKYPLADSQTTNDIVTWIHANGVADYQLGDLFAGNPTHGVNANKPLVISGVRYAVQSRDSFVSIATTRYAGQFTATALASLPANANSTNLLAAGTKLGYGDGLSYVIQPFDSLQSIADALFGGSLANLLSESDALGSTTILLPLALATLPDFIHQTGSGANLQAIASQYGLELGQLATIANGDITALFDSSDPYLDVSHLPGFRLSELIAEAQRTLAITHLSGMASRYSLNGMRLPTSGITPKRLGMWVEKQEPSGELSLPAVAGLFALTGQQFPMPTLDAKIGSFDIQVSNSAGPSWLLFKDGSGAATDTLKFPLKPGSADAQRFSLPASYAQSDRLATGVNLTVGETFRNTQLSLGLGALTQWQTPTPVELPYGQPPAGVYASQFLQLPTSVRSLPDPTTRAINPRFAVKIASYDEASGETKTRAVDYYGWASLITFTIKRVPPVVDSPASLTTYEITGASAQSAELLTELLAQHGADDGFIDRLLIGYAPDSAGAAPDGLQTDSPAGVTMGIAQVNLSTVTRPPSSARTLVELAANDDDGLLLNSKTEFVRLLWEAAITRNGGFFLYYYNAAARAGLPERIFNDKGETALTLVVLYAKPSAADQQNTIGGFMNAVAIGGNLEANATVLVEADPPSDLSDLTTSSDTLAGIAYRYYSNVGDLVDANVATLEPTAPLHLREGVYEVPPAGSSGPGGDLSAIATHFGTTTQAIIAANPKQNSWPNPLQPGTVLRLPAIDTTVAANLGGDTLQAIAAYYGIPLTALAAHNQAVPGLIRANTTLQIPGGPSVRTALVAPGVVPLAATREVPQEVPDDPKTAGYAVDFLLNTFNMLGYAIAENVDFTSSNLGLPAGPVSSSADPESMDKIRAPRALVAGDVWTYQLAVPYAKLAKPAAAAIVGLPDPNLSPYLGVGGIIQPAYQWQDLYGNTLVTTLTLPQLANATPTNLPAIALGYTDALVNPLQWPAVALDWQVTGVGAPTLAINLSFSTDTYTASSNEQWQQNAARDLRVYEQLFYQLFDPNGIALSIESSLFANQAPPVTAAQVTALEQWLFTGTAQTSSIYAYLADRAAGKTDVPAPPAIHVLSFDLAGQAINAAVIFPLALALTITRTGGAVQSDFETTAGIRSVTAAIAPISSGASGDTLSLTGFAAAFELALSRPGEYLLEVAVGVDREGTSGNDGNTVWVVRVGDGPGQALQFTVDQPGAPQRFAPRPISNVLVSRDQVPIYDYTTGQGLSETPTRTLDFSDVDLDTWARQLFAAVDDLLSPQFTAAIQLVDTRTDGESLATLLEQKRTLADIASRWMLPVFVSDQHADVSAVQEAFRQQMLGRLSDAYSTRAAIQFPTTMQGVTVEPGDIAPRLYGNINITYADVPDSLLSLTSPKLSTATGSQPLAFLFSGPELIRGEQGEVVPNIDLDLRYVNAAIEHQIAPIPGIDGDYVASTWLNFVTPAEHLSADLGRFEIPLLLRSFPTSPSATTQSGTSTNPTSQSLSDALLWDYAFAYSLPFHYPQDRVQCKVEFNIREQANLLAELDDSFAQLAQFVEVYPEVYRDLVGILAGIDATTSDPTVLNDAAIALRSTTTMLGWIINPASGADALAIRPRSGELVGDANLDYGFTVAEGEVAIDDVDALLITVINDGPLATGLTLARVLVDPDKYTLQTYTPTDGRPGDAFYWYKDNATGLPLSAAVGQALPDRLVQLVQLNLFQRQDARTTLGILRNQDLVAKQVTASEFIYRSPDITYPNPLLPSFTITTPIDIAALGANRLPVPRTLEQQLALLFGVLLAENVEPTLTFQVTVQYGYPVNAGLSSVELPVWMQPPTATAIDPRSKIPSAMISTWARAIKDWFATVSPKPVDPGGNPGALELDLTIMSNFTRQPMPLLRLPSLGLNLAYVSDVTLGGS